MAEPQYFFGWNPSPPDIRDHFYSAPLGVVSALPPRVDLTANMPAAPFSPVWEQGNLGSCGPHSAAADIVFAALRQENRSIKMPSRLFIYHSARRIMGTVDSDSGVDNRSLLKGLARYGWCDEELWPYEPGKFRVTPPQAAFQQAATRKITQYLAVPQTLSQLQGCLAGGDPFILGFTVYSSMLSRDVARSGNFPMPSLFDRVEGGHDVLCVGYDNATRRFRIRNSWGSGWGRNGYGTLPYELVLSPQMAGDFWTVRRSALPDVTPKPKDGDSMMKQIGLAILMKVLDAAAAYAATTPDQLDDMLIAALRKIIEGMVNASDKATVLAALDDAKAHIDATYTA